MIGSHVHRVLEQLPEQQRTQIELAYWSGLSQAEIAARLNLPMSTVKARTRAALMHLAELLDSAARVDVPDRDHVGLGPNKLRDG
jgi:DNA-directed RNA polymerase specialized sigma24 family protein